MQLAGKYTHHSEEHFTTNNIHIYDTIYMDIIVLIPNFILRILGQITYENGILYFLYAQKGQASVKC